MNDVRRRTVLGAGLGAIGLAVIGVGAPAADATPALPHRAHYSKSVGKMFTAQVGRHRYRVRLLRIHNVAGAPAKRRDTCFNLIFTVAGGHQLPDGTYVLTRKGVHTHRLFLSRVGQGANMQALVNRSV